MESLLDVLRSVTVETMIGTAYAIAALLLIGPRYLQTLNAIHEEEFRLSKLLSVGHPLRAPLYQMKRMLTQYLARIFAPMSFIVTTAIATMFLVPQNILALRPFVNAF